MKYCVQAWRKHLIKDIDILEKVQRRASRLMEACKGMEFGMRLKILELTTLKTRRRGDLVEVYKILNAKRDSRKRHFYT